MLRILLITASILCSYPLLAGKNPPNLSSKQSKAKIQEILRSHIKHNSFDVEIARRSLANFIDEVDPFKLYFIKSEVMDWVEPSDQLLNKVVSDFKGENFFEFEKIYQVLEQAIARRGNLELKIKNMTLPVNVNGSDFEKLEWAVDVEELQERLLRVKGLQATTAKKLDSESEALFFARIDKQRKHREEELMQSNSTLRQQQIHAQVIKAAASAADSHTVYFTPQEANQFMIQVQQRLFGIGAQLKDDLNGFTVVKIIEGGPADQVENIHTGDRIIAVNNDPVVGMEIIDVVELIRGPQGSHVTLTLLKNPGKDNEEKVDVDITRGEIILKESRYESSIEPFADGVIARIHLHSFYQDPNSSSTEDIQGALTDIENKHKLYGVILDLRNNSGGLLPVAVSTTGLFIQKGIVVSVKDNSGMVQHLRHLDGDPIWNGPLIVLTNKASASASEIVAQTLQDYGRALIIGDETTFGKGSYQTFTLESSNMNHVNPQGEYKVTRGIYYTTSGKTPQLTGAKADIVIPGIYAAMEVGEKYAKYPVDNDSIPPNFKDDLSDVHPLYRMKVRRQYMKGMQKKSSHLTSLLPTLRENSKNRIASNKNYQIFLSALNNQDPDDEALLEAGSTDLQLEEAFNVMKDLLHMQNNNIKGY